MDPEEFLFNLERNLRMWMNLVGFQPLTRPLLARGGCNVLVQLIHCFRLQFLRTCLRNFIIIERALVISQIPNLRHSISAFKGKCRGGSCLKIISLLSKVGLDQGNARATRLNGRLVELFFTSRYCGMIDTYLATNMLPTGDGQGEKDIVKATDLVRYATPTCDTFTCT